MKKFIFATAMVMALLWQGRLFADVRTEETNHYRQLMTTHQPDVRFDWQLNYTSYPYRLQDVLSTAPYNLNTRYCGLQGVLLQRGIGYCNRYANQYFQNKWERGNLDLPEYSQWLERVLDNSYCYQNGIWGKSYTEYLNPAPTYQRAVGEDINVFDYQGLCLGNNGKIDVGEWRFFLERVYDTRNNSIDPRQIKNSSVEIRTMMPRGNIFACDNCSLSWTPKIGLRLDRLQKPDQVLNTVSVDFKLRFFSGRKHRMWGMISANLQANPVSREGKASIYFEMFTF